MKLDKSRPYGTVIGLNDGTRYVQDGFNFNVHGELMPGQVIKPKKEEKPAFLPVEEDVIDGAGGEVEVSEPEEEDYETMPASEIKKRVLAAGGDYINRGEGIKFLTELEED